MKRTVILSGGLGNQMFQYAFYLSLKARGIDCKIDDTSFYSTKMHNGFELNNVFQLNEPVSPPTPLKQFWIKLLRHFKPSNLMCIDRAYQYCPEVYESNCLYYMGDWLSPLYFQSIKETVISKYQFRNISKRNTDIAAVMQASNSISVHIRRGDYLNIQNYCVCDEEYYKKAINHILGIVTSPFFYVFSNDPIWCTDFMKLFDVTFQIVDWNQGKDSYQDMYLMTQCKHSIIANSTFSWWGAWLNQSPDKKIVAPSKWFKKTDRNINCSEWHLINTDK